MCQQCRHNSNKTMKTEKSPISNDLIPELIQEYQKRLFVQVNSTMTLTYWQIGHKINHHILGNERAEYGEQLIKSIFDKLVEKFGNSFTTKNLRRMIQFSTEFQDFGIVVTLSRQLSWSHFMELMLISKKKEIY